MVLTRRPWFRPKPTVAMQPDTSTTKAQPWKAGWMARNAPGAKKAPPKGTSHGARKGDDLIIGGFTSGVSIKMTPDKAQ